VDGEKETPNLAVTENALSPDNLAALRNEKKERFLLRRPRSESQISGFAVTAICPHRLAKTKMAED
jgi:hypothetical protein